MESTIFSIGTSEIHCFGKAESIKFWQKGLQQRKNSNHSFAQDMPQGTIITEPYYTDVLVPAELGHDSSKSAE